MAFENFITKASQLASRTKLLASKYSPEILLGVGIVTGVTAAVVACRETSNLDSIVKEGSKKLDICKEERLKVVNGTSTLSREYTERMYNQDKLLITFQTGVNVVRNYAPAIALGALSIASILYSHKILAGRNLALVAAYNIVQKNFEDYRANVKERFGEDVDNELRYGVKEESVKSKETGKKETQKVVSDEAVKKLSDYSDYSRLFDEMNPNWSDSPEINKYFLRQAEAWCNNKLKAQGHLFLNEVYDQLGYDHTSAGSVVGWVLGNGDDYVDFGLFDINDKTKEAKSAFINNAEKSVIIDFNVDGVIYDKI